MVSEIIITLQNSNQAQEQYVSHNQSHNEGFDVTVTALPPVSSRDNPT